MVTLYLRTNGAHFLRLGISLRRIKPQIFLLRASNFGEENYCELASRLCVETENACVNELKEENLATESRNRGAINKIKILLEIKSGSSSDRFFPLTISRSECEQTKQINCNMIKQDKFS